MGMLLLAVFPQVSFRIERGRDWHGANATMHPDEVAYSAYVASLIRGQPRRNDPYAGRADTPGEPQSESLFSIQFLPSYLVALPARHLGLTAATVFIIFPVLCAFASSLSLFWLMMWLTHDERLAAASVWIVLGFGTLIAGQGILRYVPNLPYLVPLWLSNLVLPASVYHLPFLRFYQPAVAFPLLFALCVFIWLALVNENQSRSVIFALAAGLTFSFLVFSYFFLWTAAAAWLACTCLVWLIARPEDRKRTLIVFGLVCALALVAIGPFFILLSQRAATVDNAQALVLTHRPNLFRPSEIIAVITLGMLALGVRWHKFRWPDPTVLFTASFALAVITVFNQQVATGRSLQPIHYEWFFANYCALIALVLAAHVWWRNSVPRILTDKRLAIIAVAGLVWGGGEVWLAASLNLNHNQLSDKARPVANRLTTLAQGDGTLQSQTSGNRPVVVIDDLNLADRLPTDAPQAVLWAPRMLVFPSVTESENHERFLRQLYYTGYDERKFLAELDHADWNFYAGMFPYYRLSPVVIGNKSDISPEEIRTQIGDYLSYLHSFDRERARSPVLSYLIVHADQQPDYSNLDRWYQRDAGERIGGFILYRLKLRDEE